MPQTMTQARRSRNLLSFFYLLLLPDKCMGAVAVAVAVSRSDSTRRWWPLLERNEHVSELFAGVTGSECPTYRLEREWRDLILWVEPNVREVLDFITPLNSAISDILKFQAKLFHTLLILQRFFRYTTYFDIGSFDKQNEPGGEVCTNGFHHHTYMLAGAEAATSHATCWNAPESTIIVSYCLFTIASGMCLT